MGGYVVRGLFVQEGFGFPVVVKKIIELSLLLFRFNAPSDAECVSSPKPLPANKPRKHNRPLRALCRAAPLPSVWHNVGHP
jgi:hypothetical protein